MHSLELAYSLKAVHQMFFVQILGSLLEVCVRMCMMQECKGVRGRYTLIKVWVIFKAFYGGSVCCYFIQFVPVTYCSLKKVFKSIKTLIKLNTTF